MASRRLSRVGGGLARRAERLWGSLVPLAPVLDAYAQRPANLGLELTNLCNANCVFCPYQHQRRAAQRMPDDVFEKAVRDYVAIGGGDIELTPIVGEATIDPELVPRIRALRSHREIGRIWLITNAILLDQRGITEILTSGVSAINISTAGFDAGTYGRVYRSPAYERMRRNVLELVRENARLGRPVEITIGLRSDRPLGALLKDPDFAPILEHEPAIGYSESFSDAGGRVRPGEGGVTLRLSVLTTHRDPCAYTYFGPIVRSDGVVMLCSCIAAMDAEADLALGDIREQSLLELWRGEKARSIRASFGGPALNRTCARCTMYMNCNELRASRYRRRRPFAAQEAGR